jgi:hypothetical protein
MENNNTSLQETISELFKNEYVPEEPEKQEKKNLLFEIINAIFTDKAYLRNLTYETARQNIFMVNRRMAIKRPLEAQLFNNSDINPKDALLCWSDLLFCGYAPKWVYTPGASKSKTTSKENVMSEATIRKFMAYYGIGRRDIQACMKLFPAETEQEFKAFVKMQKEMAKNEESDN